MKKSQEKKTTKDSMKSKTGSVSQSTMSNSKKHLIFSIITALIPILFFVLLEVLLRYLNYGYDFEQWVDAGEGKCIINPNIGRKYFTNIDFNPKTIEDFFDKEKKPNAFRVFILGESTTEGFPYSPMGSFSRYLRRRLELVYPNTPIEVVNIGMSAISSYVLLDLLPGVLREKPDLIIIHSGHNEYYGVLGVGSISSYGGNRYLIKLMLYLNKFRTVQFIRDILHRIQSTKNRTPMTGTIMSNMPKEKFIEYNSKTYLDGIKQFEQNLEEMITMIKSKNIPVILGKQVCNLKDQKPFVSVGAFNHEQADYYYKEALSELRQRNYSKANELFRMAKDYDALRFRAPQQINAIIESIGKKYNVPIVSIDSIFDRESPDSTVGANLIVDHLHPNIRGHQIIGNAYYNTMQQYGYLPKYEQPSLPIEKQDHLTRVQFVFTELDSIIGNYKISLLKNNWPFTDKALTMSSYTYHDFCNLLKPKDFIDSLAINHLLGMSWVDAQLIAATYYLRSDKIENYLQHINAILYQYPILKDINTALQYFYKTRRVSKEDYTYKRIGLINLHLNYIDDAIFNLSEALKHDPNDYAILYYLALAYFKNNNYKESLYFLNEYLKVQPNDTNAKKLKDILLNSNKKHSTIKSTP